MSRTIEKKHSKISSFLVTLRQMLNNQPPQYISWGKEQNEFKIKNPSRFSEEVLPKYFKHSNLSSFIRQLNIYDFKKVSSQKYPDEYIYSHPHFDRSNPELMKNIYRKVHHLPTKHQQPNLQDIPDSSDSFENSTTHDRKKLRQEIKKLERKLSELQSMNSVICEENLQLQAKIPYIKNQNTESSKCIYKILMQSYQVQYIKFAQKIHHQLIEQSTLLNQIYQRQKQPQSNSSRFIETSEKQSTNEKKNFDNVNYNSTSSGGSLNGHSSRQNQLSACLSNQKLPKKSDRKTQPLLREQNNEAKFTNSKKNNTQNQILSQPQNLAQTHKKFQPDQENSNELNLDLKFAEKKIHEKIQGIETQRQKIECPNRCVIDLKNRRNQQQNDLSRMHKAIVLNINQFNQKLMDLAGPFSTK